MNYANSFQAVARLGLESISALLDRLGNPQSKLRCIHVAGTNGKGSVCAFLSSVLQCGGYRVGKYISPNMIRVNERISVDGVDISDKALDAVMMTVKSAADDVNASLGVYPTQFELWTAAAFLYFLECKCDICVVEVGLGGTRDATNVIEKPLYSIITSIDMDHMNYLGDTLYKIATEKAGIIKHGCPVVTFSQNETIMQAINEKCKSASSRLIIADSPTKAEACGFHEVIDCNGMTDLVLGIGGEYQPQNASLAIKVALDMGVDESALREGLAKARNIGRFEVLSQAPTLIIDGAHNASGMASLVRSLNRYCSGRSPVFVMGMMADKDCDSVFEAMRGLETPVSRVYTVSVKDNPRSETAEALAKRLAKHGFYAQACESLESALIQARNNELAVICGSLYLYKDLSEIKL